VCAGGCASNTQNLAQAESTCASQGARLCSYEEIQSGEPLMAATDCNIQSSFVWTSTQCQSNNGVLGHVLVKPSRVTQSRCFAPTVKRSVVCCKDNGDACSSRRRLLSEVERPPTAARLSRASMTKCAAPAAPKCALGLWAQRPCTASGTHLCGTVAGDFQPLHVPAVEPIVPSGGGSAAAEGAGMYCTNAGAQEHIEAWLVAADGADPQAAASLELYMFSADSVDAETGRADAAYHALDFDLSGHGGVWHTQRLVSGCVFWSVTGPSGVDVHLWWSARA